MDYSPITQKAVMVVVARQDRTMKHTHRAAFHFTPECPRCQEIVLLKADPNRPVFVIEGYGAPMVFQQPVCCCWFCYGNHYTEDCPHREEALRGGGQAAAVARSLGA